MIYITGDLHGIVSRFEGLAMPGESEWTQEDILITTGEFAFVLRGEEQSQTERDNLDYLAGKPYTILFVDGNHENFVELAKYPMEIRYGAPVRRLRPNIFWLQRGRNYKIGGHWFFTLGGGVSIDWELRSEGKDLFQLLEMPGDREYELARGALRERGYKLDYVLTHTTSANLMYRVIRKWPNVWETPLNDFLYEEIYQKADYKMWYFSHLHEDVQVDWRTTCSWFDIHTVEPREGSI